MRRKKREDAIVEHLPEHGRWIRGRHLRKRLPKGVRPWTIGGLYVVMRRLVETRRAIMHTVKTDDGLVAWYTRAPS